MKVRNIAKIKYIVGIDEVGRGPLAGPVAVCVFCIPKKFNKKVFPGARDSKKMTAEKREEVFENIEEARKSGLVRYSIQMESAKIIDAKGISWAIRNCIKKGLAQLNVDPQQTYILLDGGLKAPREFVHQQTIIRGDDKELAISLASITAKVTRDSLMKKLGKKYPLYGFEKHKGYGTDGHRKVIVKNGLSSVHRVSFCKNLTTKMANKHL